MTLVDAGPLIALIDAKDPDHARCRDALPNLLEPLVTTWPAFTEAMYLLGEAAGWAGQEKLWRLAVRGDLQIRHTPDDLLPRLCELMDKYRDTPMDLADASLIALAEQLDLKRIFTIDDDFYVYRLKGKRALEVVP